MQPGLFMLKRFFRTGLLHNQDKEPQLRDLCVINRNGWTQKVPLMDVAFARFVTTQQDAQDVIRAHVHGIEYRDFWRQLFQTDTPF